MERGYTFEELWQAARRRFRAGLVAAAAALVVGAVVVASLPDEYRAQAVIILEPYRPHSELITPAVTSLLEDRLRVARQQLLATPLLERVVKQFDLYPELRRTEGMEAAVSRLRAHVVVHPDGDSAVIVVFRTQRREEASPVVNALAQGYVEANASLRTEQAGRVLQIIEDELVSVTRGLELRERRVGEFRQAHDGELPEQTEANLREAERTARLLESTRAYVRELERRRALAPTHPTSPEVDRYSVVESDLERQLNHARTLYSEEHPEPARLAREVEGVRALKEAAISRADGLQRERLSTMRELSRTRAEASALEAQLAKAQERVSAAARWAGPLAALERERDLYREKYRSLLSRRVEGEVALALEQRSAPLATRVVDPAQTPDAPSAPDRLQLLLAILALAAGAGVGTGVLLESKDRTLRTPAQARAQLGVPLLAVLPALQSGRKP